MHHITEKRLEVRSLQRTSAVGILPQAREGRQEEEHTATTPSPLGPKRVLSRSQTSSLLPRSRNRQGQSRIARRHRDTMLHPAALTSLALQDRS
jgi:hypothetical protein